MSNKELLKYIRLFREKTNNNKLIVFVGAGVSRNAPNMPSWNELVRKMAESIDYSRCDNCTKKEENCEKNCKLKDVFSTDEYLKIPQYVFNKNKTIYNEILLANIKHDDFDAPISNAILDLVPAHVITTNYDKLIENCKSIQKDNYEVIVRDKDLLDTKKNRYIIKMHGDIDDLSTIVLKEADYLEYTQKHILIEMFIKSLLTDHTILFLGYSLNDYNVKLIVSWINHIRTQNKGLDKKTKFAYMILDEKRMPNNQVKYFEKNNIGVVNINKIPLINDIPESLTNDKGKKIYSFLKTIENPMHEKMYGNKLVYEEAINFMQQYQYVSAKNICSCLHIKKYSISGRELLIFDDIDYDELVSFLNSDDSKSKCLHQLFVDAGIYEIQLISSHSLKRDKYTLNSGQSILAKDKFYAEYIKNDYSKLNAVCNIKMDTAPFESCFYLSIIKGYTYEIFSKYDSIKYIELTTNDKIKYLFNHSTLDTIRTHSLHSSGIPKYIGTLPDKRERDIFSSYSDLLSGNYNHLHDLMISLNKLKEQYYNQKHTFLGYDSLTELYKIQRVAVEQYSFYFKNNLFFKEYTDLKKILKYYIESIVITNGDFIDKSVGAFGITSIRNRYAINEIDFDILTKFIATKDLIELIQDYSLVTFNVNNEMIENSIMCFDNIADYIVRQSTFYWVKDVAKVFINCALIISRFPLNDEHKKTIRESIIKIFNNRDFINFLFSLDFPDANRSMQVLCELLELLPKYPNLEIVNNLLNSTNFQEFYVNSNVRRLQEIVSFFIYNYESDEQQEIINNIIKSFDGRKRIRVLRLLYKYITDSKNIEDYKTFLSDNYSLIVKDDIYDFAFDGWLDINEDRSKEILLEAIKTFKNQQSTPFRAYPDPLQEQIEFICIMFITGKISDIECLREIKDTNDFLSFFLDPDKFDYSKVDFSNYMWMNIGRNKKFRDVLVQHKKDIIPNIQNRIAMGQATEFERKILYGCFLSEDELLLK